MRYTRIVPLLIAAPLAACLPSERSSTDICGARIDDCAAAASAVQRTATSTGHRCDTVDRVGRLTADKGFYFSCNHRSYAYRVAIFDGRWFLTRR